MSQQPTAFHLDAQREVAPRPVRYRRWRSVLAAVVGLLLVAGVQSAEAGSRAQDRASVAIQRIGRPSWKPVDINVFSAPIGTASSEYAEFGTTIATLLPEPNHASHPDLGIGPGAPHGPSYRREISDGVENAGYETGRCFTAEQFSEGAGVFAVWMVVPEGRRNVGSSPDFARGPIVPNDLFPIHVHGASFRNGQPFASENAAFDVPALDDVDPPFLVDGHSHFPVFIADNADFGPSGTPLPGSYTYDLIMLDNSGSGWSIVVSFVIDASC